MHVHVAAVHRYYESRRRLFNDEKPERSPKATITKINTRKRLLRRKVFMYYFCNVLLLCTQLYTDRQKVLKNDKERELWCSLNHDYMTEESEQENDEGQLHINQHFLSWRSHSKSPKTLII